MFSHGKILPILTALGTAVTTAAVIYHYKPNRKLIKLTNEEGDPEDDQLAPVKTETPAASSVIATIASESLVSEEKISHPAEESSGSGYECSPKSRMYRAMHATMMHLQDASMVQPVYCCLLSQLMKSVYVSF